MKPVTLLVIALFLSLTPGCRTVYLEEETPPGRVPPVPVDENPTTELPRDSMNLADVMDRPTGLASGLSADTLAKFKAVYAQKGRPRIAVFLNRQLSAEVREWDTRSRIVATGDVKVTHGAIRAEENRAGGKLAVEATEVEGGDGAVYGQTHIDQPARAGMPEDWRWQFEDSVLRELLRAQVIVVDRSTILRLVAEKSGKQGDAHKLLAVKAVEIKALREHADLFMELLVRRNPRARAGYEFRASVKDVTTGRILVNVTSLAWRQKDIKVTGGKRFKATSEGYVKVKQGDVQAMGQIAGLLAQDAIRSLLQMWSAE